MVLSSLKGDWLNFPEEHAYENQASCYLKENAETRQCLSNVCDNKKLREIKRRLKPEKKEAVEERAQLKLQK